MSEYRIEKVRRRVSVTLAGGVVLGGDVFLQPTARYRAGPQEPVELFNEAEPFLPLATDGDDLVLIAKRQVVTVEFAAESADTPTDGVPDVDIRCVFADGSECAGALHMEVRASRSRLLDFLNEDSHRFLVLRSGAVTRLVNCAHVVQVHHRR